MTTFQKGRLSTWFHNFTWSKPRIKRGAAWGGIILIALVAFEVFNFSTTQFALFDVLGESEFAGLKWASILAIAFCGIDFAGIARIFTPEQGRDEPAEVWYLFGAWLLAAFMNASLTWWGISVAIVNQPSASGDAVISETAMTKIVPVFVAVMILLIRVLLISTLSVSGERLFTTDERRITNRTAPQPAQEQTYRPASSSILQPASNINRPVSTNQSRPVNQPILQPASNINRPISTNQTHLESQTTQQSVTGINRPTLTNQPSSPTSPKHPQQTSYTRPEPTYHNDPLAS